MFFPGDISVTSLMSVPRGNAPVPGGGTPIPGEYSRGYSSTGWGVCPFTPWGVPQSQVLSEVTGPRFFPGGTPFPGSFSGHWSQVLSGGVGGVHQSQQFSSF